MRCDETQERVSLYVDSDLAEEGQGPMFRHLEGCPDCRSFMESMIRLRKDATAERETLLSEAGEVLPGAAVILRRARRPERSLRSALDRLLGRGFQIPTPIAVGIGVLLLIAGIMFGSRFPRGGAGTSTRLDRIDAPSHPAVVVVCGMPEVEVVGSDPHR